MPKEVQILLDRKKVKKWQNITYNKTIGMWKRV